MAGELNQLLNNLAVEYGNNEQATSDLSTNVLADNDGYTPDCLYQEAKAFVTESRKATVSAIQRELRIGYNRAASLIERMEAEGVVSSPSPNGGRTVLVSGSKA
jgi:DNA segregation ATPase FtsK/SpoIIIE-like protein